MTLAVLRIGAQDCARQSRKLWFSNVLPWPAPVASMTPLCQAPHRLAGRWFASVAAAGECGHVQGADHLRAFASASSFSSWLTRSCSVDNRVVSRPTLKNVTLLAGASSVLP